MKQNIIKINLWGVLGEVVGKEYNLAVNTLSAALNAIEVLSNRKLYRFLRENDKKGIKYRVLLNGRDFAYDLNNPPDPNDLESITSSELCAKTKNLKTIDIVPVIEGSGGNGGSIGAIIVGIILVIVGIFTFGATSALGVSIIIGGLGLVAAGVLNLLSQPPELQPFKDKQKSSYLFNGPENTINEGGPVPVGYGRLIVGSAVISASYDIGYFDASDNTRIVQPTKVT